MFEAFVSVTELASAAVGACLGLEMLSHLHTDRTEPDALFDAALPLATMIDALRTD